MIKVKVKIKLYAGENGRKTPFLNQYRPLFGFDGGMKTSGQILLLDREKFFPGDEGIVEVMFLNKEYLGQNLELGNKFTFGEGIENLGEGEVLEILH